MKNSIVLLSISLFVSTATLMGDDFVTIIDPIPSGYGTVTATPLIIDGTSSQPNMQIALAFNGNATSSAYSDEYGNWSITSPYLGNGTYILTAALITSNLQTLAVDMVTFTVQNGNTISINSPAQDSPVYINPILLSGASSLPNAIVNISLDNTLEATTTTDANGNWQYLYTLSATHDVHTFLIELLDSDYSTTASNTVTITNNIPFVFPSGISQARFVNGDIPTSGSGSGPGYTYAVSGSSITINFIPAFNTSPSIAVTGLRSAGSTTVSLSSASATAATLTFSTGTQSVHFSAATLQ